MADQALTKRSTDMALMPPPPKRQKRPAKVLDEDVYSDALSHIIARDFFPALLETEAQQEYMSALDSNDGDWIRAAGRNLTQVMTPVPDGRRRMGGRGTGFTTPRRSGTGVGETPRGSVGETPLRTPRTEANDDFAPEERKPDVDVNMSLGAFQAKYTSEDNESFNALLDQQNAKRAAKYAFFHRGNNIPSARQIAHRAREQRLLQNGDTSASSNALITTNSAGEQRKAIAPARPSEDLDSRPASLDGFRDTEGPRNHFMFGPDGVEGTLTTHAQEREQKSLAPPKAVQYSGTRFNPSQNAQDTVPPSPSMSAVDAAIAGRPFAATASEPGYTGAETPRVAGYAFVDAEPTPSELGVPVTDEEAEAAEREAALALLPKAEGEANPFTIHERSKREDLLHRLVEKADAGRRRPGGGDSRVTQLKSLGITPGGRTPTPRFASAPAGKKGGTAGMTPAGRMLAARIGGATPRREGSGFGGTTPQRGGSGSGGWTPKRAPSAT